MTALAARAARWRLREPAAVGAAGLAAVMAVLAPLRPEEVLIAAAAILVFVLCIRHVEIALLVLVSTAPLEAAFQISPQITFTKLAGALCFVTFGLNAIGKQRKLVVDRAHAAALLILALAMLSSALAEETAPAIATTTRYASYVALLVVVSQFVGAHRLFSWIAWVLSLASSVAGILALSSFFSGRTILASLPYTNENDTAFILATTVPLTLWLLRERGLRRVLVLAMLALISVSILLTFSRGAMVGLVAAFAWTLLADRRYTAPVLIAVVAAAVGLFVAYELYHHRIEAGLQAKAQVANENVHERLGAWLAAGQFAVDHPLLGVGPGNFRDQYTKVLDPPPGQRVIPVVHNSYLDVAAEVGPLAALLFLGYLVLAFSRLSEAKREGRGPPGFAAAVEAGLIVAVFAGLTLSEQFFAPFWLFGGLAIALHHEPAGRSRALPAEA